MLRIVTAEDGDIAKSFVTIVNRCSTMRMIRTMSCRQDGGRSERAVGRRTGAPAAPTSGQAVPSSPNSSSRASSAASEIVAGDAAGPCQQRHGDSDALGMPDGAM